MPGTSFARLLPPLNSFSHTPDPPVSSLRLRQKVIEVLRSVGLMEGDAQNSMGDDGETVKIAPVKVTWSRTARRQAAREAEAGIAGLQAQGDEAALFTAEIVFTRSDSAAAAVEASDTMGAGDDRSAQQKAAENGGTVKLVWLEGRDRTVVEALWKFILTKAQLLGHPGKPQLCRRA